MTPTSLLDYTIYTDAFSSATMRALFDERAAVATWVEVERAVARAQGRVGIIPEDAASAIDRSLDADKIDLNQLRDDTRDVGRPVVGLVKQLATQIAAEHARWIHFGHSTYDTMDTATAVQVQRGTREMQARLSDLRTRWENLAQTHRNTLMIGRTNGQHAQPTTFGARVATWIEELTRHQQQIDHALNETLQFQLGSMVGSLACFGDDGIRLREALADELGLAAPLSNWHNARDGVARLLQHFGLVNASLARIARDIASLESTDFGEVVEQGDAGRGRSSGMPHKRNPRSAEYAEAVATLCRHRAAGAVEIMGQEHERSGGTYIAEWVIVPEVFLLASGAVHWMTDLTDRIAIDEQRMRQNIDALQGMALSERYTIFMSSRMSKFDARRLLDEACAITWRDGGTLASTLKAMPEVTRVLTIDEIDELSDPATYLGTAGDMIDKVIEHSRAQRY